MLESALSAIPVAARAVGGIPTVVRDGVTGALAHSLTVDDLAAALETALSHPDMGVAARTNVETNHDLGLTAQLWLSLISRLSD